MGNPINQGPNGDGSRSLAKESKVGIAVTFVATALGTAALEWLSGLDTSDWAAWWSTIAVAGVSTAVGLLSAWLKRNR